MKREKAERLCATDHAFLYISVFTAKKFLCPVSLNDGKGFCMDSFASLSSSPKEVWGSQMPGVVEGTTPRPGSRFNWLLGWDLGSTGEVKNGPPKEVNQI